MLYSRFQIACTINEIEQFPHMIKVSWIIACNFCSFYGIKCENRGDNWIEALIKSIPSLLKMIFPSVSFRNMVNVTAADRPTVSQPGVSS